jgi:hypothetical protein
MSFRRRSFPEVLDSLLTSVTQGVAAESYPFPPGDAAPFRHSLQQPPVADIISVYGSRNGQPHLFRRNVDYELVQGRSLEWKPGGELPDAGSLISVNYYPQDTLPVLTDIQTGSVIRTLAESVSLELARLYAQLEGVYQSGFIDTATGKALENVVALLGISRIAGGRAVGEVEFTRSPASPGTIDILAGTRIITPNGDVEYETTAAVTMGLGQDTVRVAVRDREINPPLPADSLTILPIPIAGIARVTNPAPTVIDTQDETDTELRARAKSFLHGSERGTLGAIQQAIARQGVKAEVVEIPDKPGHLKITPIVASLTPEQEQRLQQAVKDAKPAGIKIVWQLPVPPRKVNLSLRLTPRSDLLEQDIRTAQRQVRERLTDYFARLSSQDNASLNQLANLVLSLPQFQDVRFLSASLGEGATATPLSLDSGELALKDTATALGDLHIANPGLPTQLRVSITYPAAQSAPDQAAIQTALNQTVTYLNNLNASDLPASAPEQANRQLSYGKWLLVISLPGKPGAALEGYDQAVTKPALPTSGGSYSVTVTLTQESGFSQILSQATDPAYILTPFERLSLSSVDVYPQGGS